MARRRNRRGSRRGSRRSNALPWIIVSILLLGLGIYFVAKNIDNGDVCGERGIDEEKKGYCQVSDKDYGQLVIVAGNTQNTPTPNLDFTDGDLRDILAGVFYSSETNKAPDIKIISAAKGNEDIAFKNNKPAKNISASNNNLMKLGRSINEAIKSEPKHNGADYFNAILEANRYLNSSNANSQKLILVIGSGYSDSGVLDFAHGGIFDKYIANKSNIEAALREDERIKGGELSGTAVYWYNMSYVTSPQPSMEDYRNATTDIYETALRYAGVTNMRLNLKVKRAQASINTIHTVDPVYVEPLKPGDYLSIDDTVSRFLNNQTILQNPEYVKSYISTFVQKLKDTSYSLLVTGYMDHCLPDNRALSKGRAEVIKGLLIEMGISGDKIETYGEYGPPPKDPNAQYVCQDDDNIPDEEQRTVRIVVK